MTQKLWEDGPVANARTAWTYTSEEAVASIQEWAAQLRKESRAGHHFSRAYHYLYPPAFWTDMGSLRSCDPGRLENAVVFLEADPWCFHSGYVKARLLRYLKKRGLVIPEPYAERLRRVILTAVDKRGGWEFKWYCRLGSKVQSAGFRQELDERLNHTDAKVKRRAQYLIHYLETGRL